MLPVEAAPVDVAVPPDAAPGEAVPVDGEETESLALEETDVMGFESNWTTRHVRLKSGVVLSWEPTMPKLGLGLFG